MLFINHFYLILSLSFILSVSTSQQINPSTVSRCYDHYSTHDKYGPNSKLKSNNCNIKPIQTYRTLWKRSNLGQQDKDHRIITPTSNKVQVDFYCEAAKELCKNIENGLISMAVFLENAINLTHPISIQASFYPFCEGKDECPEGDNYMLGQALPSRSFPIADEKGIIRLYPQALYKQLIPKKPRNVEYHQYDIFAEFNSKAPYYFPNSRIKGGDKASFLDLISHELLHGLGFVTSIDDHFNKGLATFLPDIQSEDKDSKQVQVRFIQFVFDKFLVFSNPNNTIEKYIQLFNKNNLLDAENPLKEGSKLGNIAKDLTKQVTIKDNLFFQINKDTLITLETSLVPYAPGSSISHLDKSKYLNTADSLMCYRMEDKDIYEVMKSIGTWNTAPYGPNTLAILEAMGYTLTKNPSQEHSYNMLFTSKNSSSITNNSNLLLFFIMLILSLIN